MKVIITNTFQKEYLEYLSIYFKKLDLVNYCKKKDHTFIPLHYPFFKLKNKINNVAFRGVLAVIKNERIIPLMIFLKKDKKYGENINWKTYGNKAVDEYDKAVEDIENGNYEEF